MLNPLVLRRTVLGFALLLSTLGLTAMVLKEPSWSKDEAVYLGEYAWVLGAAEACRMPVASQASHLKRWVQGHFRPYPEYFLNFSDQLRAQGRLQQATDEAACAKARTRYKALDWSRTELTFGERLFLEAK